MKTINTTHIPTVLAELRRNCLREKGIAPDIVVISHESYIELLDQLDPATGQVYEVAHQKSFMGMQIIETGDIKGYRVGFLS